jgi:hypothetical protein
MKDLLIKLNACQDAKDWAADLCRKYLPIEIWNI